MSLSPVWGWLLAGATDAVVINELLGVSHYVGESIFAVGILPQIIRAIVKLYLNHLAVVEDVGDLGKAFFAKGSFEFCDVKSHGLSPVLIN